jgi:hypothetical protein
MFDDPPKTKTQQQNQQKPREKNHGSLINELFLAFFPLISLYLISLRQLIFCEVKNAN